MGKRVFVILVADRNPHVRDFLKREMVAAGYRVHLAENGKEVIKRVYHSKPLDLLILDPDLPDLEESAVLKKLKNRIPNLPVVLHSYCADFEDCKKLLEKITFVEKGGNSVEHLKQVISDILDQQSRPYEKNTRLKLTN